MFDFHSEGVVPTTSLGTILRALGLVRDKMTCWSMPSNVSAAHVKNPTDWEILDYIEQFDEDETDCLELTEVLKSLKLHISWEVLLA